jgi:hypothetical protein
LCSDPDFRIELENGCNYDDRREPLDEERQEREMVAWPEREAVDLFSEGYDTSKARLAIGTWMNLREGKYEEEALNDMQRSAGKWFLTRFLTLNGNSPESILYGVTQFLNEVNLCEALNNRYNEDEKNVIRAVLRQGPIEEKLVACKNFLRPHLEGQISRMLGNDTL